MEAMKVTHYFTFSEIIVTMLLIYKNLQTTKANNGGKVCETKAGHLRELTLINNVYHLIYYFLHENLLTA